MYRTQPNAAITHKKVNISVSTEYRHRTAPHPVCDSAVTGAWQQGTDIAQ